MNLAGLIRGGVARAFQSGITDLNAPLTLNHDASLEDTYDVATGTTGRNPVSVAVPCVAASITQEDVDNGFAPDKAGRKFIIEQRALERACLVAQVPLFTPEVAYTTATHEGVNYTLSRVRTIPGGSAFVLFGRLT